MKYRTCVYILVVAAAVDAAPMSLTKGNDDGVCDQLKLSAYTWNQTYNSCPGDLQFGHIAKLSYHDIRITLPNRTSGRAAWLNDVDSNNIGYVDPEELFDYAPMQRVSVGGSVLDYVNKNPPCALRLSVDVPRAVSELMSQKWCFSGSCHRGTTCKNKCGNLATCQLSGGGGDPTE